MEKEEVRQALILLALRLEKMGVKVKNLDKALKQIDEAEMFYEDLYWP